MGGWAARGLKGRGGPGQGKGRGEGQKGSRARASLRAEGVQDKGGLEASDTTAVENVRGQERIKNQITGGLRRTRRHGGGKYPLAQNMKPSLMMKCWSRLHGTSPRAVYRRPMSTLGTRVRRGGFRRRHYCVLGLPGLLFLLPRSRRRRLWRQQRLRRRPRQADRP